MNISFTIRLSPRPPPCYGGSEWFSLVFQPLSVFGLVRFFPFQSFDPPHVQCLAPAIRSRFLRQQEASVPPEGSPQFSCVTPRPGAWLQ